MIWRKIDDKTPYGRYVHVIDDEGLEHIATRLDVDVWTNAHEYVKAVAWLETPECPKDLV